MSGRVHGVIARLVGHHGARAEDLTQETFVRAWQALPGYRFESAFGTWLYRLAANTALMELRARRSRPQSDGDAGLDDIGTPDSAGHATALSLDLERAVATLPPRARAVLVLFDVEGWKHEEIAEALGMAVGSSKAQLHRARGLLRTRLGDEPCMTTTTNSMAHCATACATPAHATPRACARPVAGYRPAPDRRAVACRAAASGAGSPLARMAPWAFAASVRARGDARSGSTTRWRHAAPTID